MRKSRPTGRLLLVADAGATHTRVLVVSPGGHILGRGNAGPGNAFAVGSKLALANLDRAVHAALTSARVSSTKIACTVVGSASIDSDGRGSKPIESELHRHFPSARRMAVADSVIALEGALTGAAGVVIVSGTGSVVLGKAPRKKAVRVGGWGPLFGDEGSAQWIVREGLRLAAHASDETGAPTSLTRIFKRHFRLRSFTSIIEVIYINSTPAKLGALAPLVANAAASSDAVAQNIFSRAGEALAAQAAAVVRRLGIPQGIVSYQGSMFLTGKLLLNPLKAALRRYAPQARLVAPALPPIGGAYLLGLRLIGQPLEEPAVATFRRNFYA